MISKKVIQSYVWYNDKCYFVSTIERDSSVIEYAERYNETIVWEYDYEKRERGKMLLQDEDMKCSIDTHNDLCSKIFYEGLEEKK